MQWNNNFFNLHPIYEVIESFKSNINKLKSCPNIKEFNSLSNGLITCIEQLNKSDDFFKTYDALIFNEKKLLTRIQNWHDIFNFLTWIKFFKIKKEINKQQYLDQHKRFLNKIQKRTTRENVLTQFDECGMITISSSDEILSLLTNFEFKKAFNHPEITKTTKFITIGHATMESALNPYIGLTSKSILCKCKENLIKKSINETIDILNDIISYKIKEENIFSSNKYISPIPVLGIPKWHPNQDEHFYNNKEYFRNKNSNKKEAQIIIIN